MIDVTAAFADLGEHYPGSRQKRRAVAGPPPVAEPEGEGWDKHPIFVTVGQERVEFFYIGGLAAALHRKPTTIRKWLSQGILPPARFWTHSPDPARGSRRLWTRAQIEGIARIAAEEGILTGRPVGGTEFTSRVRELFRVLKASEPKS